MIDNESEPGSWAQHLEFNGMTDTPPDWVLIEAAKRSKYEYAVPELFVEYEANAMFRALCDMIQKYEQPPVDRKLLCAREAMAGTVLFDPVAIEGIVSRAIELYLEGYGE
jgi:hypothetical protein